MSLTAALRPLLRSRLQSTHRNATTSPLRPFGSLGRAFADDGHVHSESCGHHHHPENTKETQLRSTLQSRFVSGHTDVRDVSGGCGASFVVLVVSPEFEGKSKLQRQRMVNEALAPYMTDIHAIQQHVITPDEWKARLDAHARSQENAAK